MDGKKNGYISYEPEDLFFDGEKSQFTVLDFWKFHYSYLAGQSPAIAEFLVARALGKEKAENVGYWTAYDMMYRDKRIEVKSTEYIHFWNHKRVSEARSFSIAPTKNRYWDNGNKEGLSRQNDIYIFCLNTNRELQNPKPLDISFWEFYVVSTAEINRYTERNGNPDQKTISLKVIKKMTDAVLYKELRNRVDCCIDQMSR